MTTTYSATYHTANGRYYQAVIFLSAVTITIRYRNEENQEKDVNWLTKDIIVFNKLVVGGELQYRNASGEIERLGIRDQQLIDALQKTLSHHRVFGNAPTRVLGNIWIKLGGIALIILLLLLATYIWLVPVLGENMANRFSKQSEISMGEQMYQSVKSQYRIDSQKTAILNEFYKQLHYNVGYPVSITVVESNEMNAFAIPGGHIVVYDAILDRMKTPEELAALLGHEASHIALRHSLRNIFRSMARQMFLSVIVGDQSGIASVVVNNADALKGLQYSRSLETEADDNGLQLMVKNNINPQGMRRLMQLLQKESGGGEPAAFLSTHPVFKDRIKNIETKLQQLPAVTTANDSLKTIFHSIYE
ncbi:MULTISPECIES: M48 family metallopeptidase [Niastella]|uniref:M48 family metallopeptidase n=1 Tax=Niastella soli TaxID=2821487 RepID=A0ABS3Z4L1_9BACT|nr:M48 family metallopeptidase [Niastella soli]MBO9205100.1 M48 family metallopeptidase [Niastella soli]